MSDYVEPALTVLSASSLPSRVGRLQITFHFHNSRIALSKSLFYRLNAEVCPYIHFVIVGKACYVTRARTGEGLKCQVYTNETSDVRSVIVRKKTLMEDMRIAWGLTHVAKVTIAVSCNPIVVIGLDTDRYPNPVYRLLI